MNAQDTAAVIAYFGAAWPSFDPSDDTLDVWAAEVSDIDVDDAAEAMRTLVQNSDFAPSIAKFRAECLAVRLHNNLPALPAWGEQQPWPKELVDELRAVLARGGARDHRHGGPDPCPVCGGMNITPSKRHHREPLEKTWCSRCGSNSMPLPMSLEAKPVDTPTPWSAP